MDRKACKEKIIQGCKAQWDANSKLRSEFYYDFDDFLTFKLETLKKSINVSGSISLSNEDLAGNAFQNWKRDSNLRNEFGSLATYFAYRRAEVAGRI